AGTGLLNREETLLHAHLAVTTARGTGDWLGALLGATAVTGFAANQGRDANSDRGAAYGLFQVKLQRIAQIAAALHIGTTTPACGTAENVTKDITEYIREVAAATAESAGATTHALIDASMAVLIIGCALVGVRENFISLVGFFEFLLR